MKSPGSLDDPQPKPSENEAPAGVEIAQPRERRYDRWLIVGLPVAIATLSLVFSFYIWYEGNRPPVVELNLPDRVRVTQGTDRAWLYIQPRFVSTSQNDRIDVITSIKVEVAPVDNGTPASFEWDEQGAWVFDHDTRSLSWDWLADPGPLVVSPANPQMPTGLFMATEGWLWEAGDYVVTVTANQSVDNKTLTQSGAFSLSDDEISQLESSPASIFLTVRLLQVEE